MHTVSVEHPRPSPLQSLLGRALSLRRSVFAAQAAGKLRRLFLVHLRPGYVEGRARARAGACLRCGRCCALAFTCPLLLRDGSCSSYGLARPKACQAFPIDQRDIDDVAAGGAGCGYRFGEAPDPHRG